MTFSAPIFALGFSVVLIVLGLVYLFVRLCLRRLSALVQAMITEQHTAQTQKTARGSLAAKTLMNPEKAVRWAQVVGDKRALKIFEQAVFLTDDERASLVAQLSQQKSI